MRATEVLMQEHRLIVRGLDVLAAMVRRLDAGVPVEPSDVERLVEFFKGFADAFHHAKEEEHLFPAMVAAGLPPDGGPIAVMLEEHDHGRRLLAAIVKTAGALADSDEARRQFAAAASAYVDLLGTHISKENLVLFRMADQLLDEGVQARLGDEFAGIEGVLGHGEKWRRVVETLEESVRK